MANFHKLASYWPCSRTGTLLRQPIRNELESSTDPLQPRSALPTDLAAVHDDLVLVWQAMEYGRSDKCSTFIACLSFLTGLRIQPIEFGRLVTAWVSQRTSYGICVPVVYLYAVVIIMPGSGKRV